MDKRESDISSKYSPLLSLLVFTIYRNMYDLACECCFEMEEFVGWDWSQESPPFSLRTKLGSFVMMQ